MINSQQEGGREGSEVRALEHVRAMPCWYGAHRQRGASASSPRSNLRSMRKRNRVARPSNARSLRRSCVPSPRKPARSRRVAQHEEMQTG